MGKRKIRWISVSTIVSAAVLIGTEVFGMAYAGGWAFGHLLNLGDYGTYALQAILLVGAVVLMAKFLQRAIREEPLLGQEDDQDRQSER